MSRLATRRGWTIRFGARAARAIVAAACTAMALAQAVGDAAVLHAGLGSWARAAADNVAHAIIAALCYAAASVRVDRALDLRLAALAVLSSSAVDADHFIAARSFRLDAATHLASRPVLHCSTPLVALALGLAALERARPTTCARPGRLRECVHCVALSLATHHLRDASRRGVWMCPLGSSRPLGTLLSCVALVGLAVAAAPRSRHGSLAAAGTNPRPPLPR